MDFENELISGVLVKRYKRFFADIKVNNKIITAHCPNPGSMLNLINKGNPVWITKSDNENRKLKYTLQIIQVDNSKFCINTHITNKIVLDPVMVAKGGTKLINNTAINYMIEVIDTQYNEYVIYAHDESNKSEIDYLFKKQHTMLCK